MFKDLNIYESATKKELIELPNGYFVKLNIDYDNYHHSEDFQCLMDDKDTKFLELHNGMDYLHNSEQRYDADDYSGWYIHEIEQDLKKRGMIFAPVTAYIHSGTRVWFGGYASGWDSGIAGYYVVSKEALRERYKVKRITKKIINRVYYEWESLTKYWDEILNENTYGYILYDKSGDIVDSCSGFLGDSAIKAELKYLAGLKPQIQEVAEAA